MSATGNHTPAPNARAPHTAPNRFLCPNGPHLVCRDFNAMPQRMWRTDRQTWPCEGCGAPMERTFGRGSGWSPWRPVTR